MSVPDWTPVRPAVRPPAPEDSRPAWARNAHLPTYDALRYVQTLAVAIVAVLLGTYLLARVLRDPSALVKAARKRTGV